MPSRKVGRVLLWIGASVLGLLLVLIVALALMDWNALRGPVSRMASRAMQRPVSIDGSLHVHVFSLNPSVDVEGLKIGNPPWVGKPDMVQLPRLHLAAELGHLLIGRVILTSLELDDPDVLLVRDEHGRANWETGNSQSKPAGKSAQLPAVQHFELSGGHLELEDAAHKLTFNGRVGAQEKGSRHRAEPFSLKGEGTLNKEPFKLEFSGGPLLDVKLDHPYDFQMDVEAGPSKAKIHGSIAKPFDLNDLTGDVELQGQNLANLYYLTNLALPLTPPYQLAVHVHRAESHFTLDHLVGKIGNSDIRGDGSVDIGKRDARPRLTAHLTSHSLNLSDLGVALGARVEPPGQQRGKAPPQVEAPKNQPVSPLLLPTFEFQFDRLKSTDADVAFQAESVQAQKVPIQNVSYHLKLDHGDLKLDPLQFTLPEGKIAGTVELDARQATPETRIDLRLSDVKLDQFKPKGSQEPPLEGVMEGRLRVEGTGNSVHAIASDGNGMLSLVLPNGQISEAFAELTGIDVVRGLGLLMTDKEKTIPIRCGVIEFQLKDGDARAEHLLFDTQNVIVTGDGHIAMNDEALDLNLKGEPKKPRFDRLRSPVNVRGTLRHPKVGLSTSALAKQGAAAAALGAVATPFAALLAFIDPGLAKNADCAGLTSEAQDKVANAQPADTRPADTQPADPQH